MTIAIIKAGRTYDHMKVRYGDFEDWIMAGLGLENKQVWIINVTNGEPLPDLSLLSGIVITGSHDSVLDDLPWKASTSAWIREAVICRIPLLGICFGHQLLAHAMGGEVADNPKGSEFGSVRLTILIAAEKDRLFQGIGDCQVNVSHWQSVTVLPKNAVLLAHSEMESHQAFCIDDIAWGVQFHPEFNQYVTKDYILSKLDYFKSQGINIAKMKTACKESAIGSLILQRFLKLTTQPAVVEIADGSPN